MKRTIKGWEALLGYELDPEMQKLVAALEDAMEQYEEVFKLLALLEDIERLEDERQCEDRS